MDTKPDNKSKIPQKVTKKEKPPEKPRMTFGNCNYLKANANKENKEKTIPIKNTVHIATRNLKVTTKEKIGVDKKDSKPNISPPEKSDIETLSQDLAKHMKSAESPNCDGNQTNVNPKNNDGARVKIRAKDSTSPNALVKPKTLPAHSGLILKPTNKKSTGTVKPFNNKPNPPKIRRSISEYDFKLGRPKPEINRPQQKDRNVKEKILNAEKHSVKTVKPSVASRYKKPSLRPESKPQNEIPVPPKSSIVAARVTKQFAVDKNSAKPGPPRANPLRRSNTMHAFDSVPGSKKGLPMMKSPIPKIVVASVKSEKGNTPGTPENPNSESPLSEHIQAQFTPKKEIPHGGMVLKIKPSRKVKEKINAFKIVE